MNNNAWAACVNNSRTSTRVLAAAVMINWTLTLYYWSWLCTIRSRLETSDLSKSLSQNGSLALLMERKNYIRNADQASKRQPAPRTPIEVVPALRRESKVKWFVYDMPEQFLTPAHESVKMGYAPYAAELHFLGEVEKRRVFNPEHADVFYVPMLPSAFLMGQEPGQPMLERQAHPKVRSKAIRMVNQAITWVQTNFPYWNQSQGADHVFFFSHENGPCLDITSERAKQNPRVLALFERLKNSLILSHTGDRQSGCYDASRTVILPPPVPNALSVRRRLERSQDFEQERTVFLFFRDTTTVHSKRDEWQAIRMLYGKNGTRENLGLTPKLEPCLDSKAIKSPKFCERMGDKCKEPELYRRRVFSRGVRQNLNIFFEEFAKICTNCTERTIRYSDKVKDIETRMEEMSDSTFCLSTRGWADWNVRTMEAMVAGCIPVIISDDAELPFSDLIDWNSVSIRIQEAFAQNIYDRLSRVRHAEIVQLRKNIKATVLNLTYPHIDKRGLVVHRSEEQLYQVLQQRKKKASQKSDAVARNTAPPKAYPKAIAAKAGVKEDEICLAVQMSPDRINMLAEIARRWQGHVVAIVSVPSDHDDFVAGDARKSFFEGFGLEASERQELEDRIVLEFYRAPKEWKYYPVNKLRNMALRGCAERAQFAMTMDVDFIPSTDAYSIMQTHVAKLLKAEAPVGRRALVVPAFESSDESVQSKEMLDQMLRSKAVIADMYLSDRKYRQRQTKNTKSLVWPFDQKRSPTGHRASNSEFWMKAWDPYRVEYKWGWEPYLLLRAPFPEYDESFVEYGQNKVLYAYELLAAGFEFVVLPDTWIIHAHVDPNKKEKASKPKQYQVGWSCWADFIVRVQQTYDGFRLPTPCWAAKYVYPVVTNLYQDRCIGNPPGDLMRLT